MKIDLKLKGYSPKTQAAYLGYMKNFARYFGRSPAKMGKAEIREYLSDIDSKRMQLRVAQGKGKKDRYALLSPVTLNLLRDYWRRYRPKVWLFPGRLPDSPISTRSIQKIFKNAKRKAGTQKPATVHTLQHSFATHHL